MREIKFRGFDVVGDKGWVYGDLVHNQKVTTTGLTPRVMVGGYEVSIKSIGQFTGLRDKNGKEIYEGDIVQCADFVYEVIYDDKRFASFVLFRLADAFKHYFGEAVEAYQCEIIGNVYNNPNF